MKKHGFVIISLFFVIGVANACSFSDHKKEVRINNQCSEDLKVQIESYTPHLKKASFKRYDVKNKTAEIMPTDIPQSAKDGYIEVKNLQDGTTCYIHKLQNPLVNVEFVNNGLSVCKMTCF